MENHQGAMTVVGRHSFYPRNATGFGPYNPLEVLGWAMALIVLLGFSATASAVSLVLKPKFR